MPVQARDIMTREVLTIASDATLGEAAAAMADRRVSCLPVVDGGQLVGILTETDIVRCIERELPSSGTARPLGSHILWTASTDYLDVVGQLDVDQAMTREVIRVGPADSVETVADVLARHHIKRVPVVLWNAVVGIVSQMDLVRLLAADTSLTSRPPERLGWLLIPATGFLPHAQHVTAAPGLTIDVDSVHTPFEDAPAAYPDVAAALSDAAGLTACRVRLSGEMVERDGRTAATRWQCLWTADAAPAVVDWTAEAVERALLREEELGQSIDARAWETVRAVRRTAAAREDPDRMVPALREATAERAADLRLPTGVGAAFDGMLEGASAMVAAREPGRNAMATRTWHMQVVHAALDVLHRVDGILPVVDAKQLRTRLSEAVLELALAPAEAARV